MALQFIGDHPLAKDEHGNLKSRIGTVFPSSGTVVTTPGVHATQKVLYVQTLNGRRQAQNLPPLTEAEELAEWQNSVDLIMENDTVLIRPDPERMDLAFAADELLQEIVSKRGIKFLYVLNEKVRRAIRERGERWRMSSMPRSPAEIVQMIRNSRIGIRGRPIYYYNKTEGTRYLTVHEFARLGELAHPELTTHLEEIRHFSGQKNRLGNPEVDFFLADDAFGNAVFLPHEFSSGSEEKVRRGHQEILEKFRGAVPPDMQTDDPDNLGWRNRLYASLIEQDEGATCEDGWLGLSSEFFMQIEWLPGARIEGGELLFDSVFDEAAKDPGNADLRELCDEKARSFIFNFVREFGDLRYVNVGRVITSLSRRPAGGGRREVFIAEIGQRGRALPRVKIIRMQKWSVREHLDEGKDLLTAIYLSEEYTDYVLDRRLACRQLGMNLSTEIVSGKITEAYDGATEAYRGSAIWSPYFERDYISGAATDKIPACRHQDEAFSLKLAFLLGEAAAPNMIVGRCNADNSTLFDDGDEVLLEDRSGAPAEILVTDQTGAFWDYRSELEALAPAYARPVNRRTGLVRNPAAFADRYLEAFVVKFAKVQGEYCKRKRMFDALFKHRPRDEKGSFAYRWERVLDRLNRADPSRLADAIRKAINLPGGP